eukprot:TRINITY_DN53631_c0_g1_i1.p1 TRINITY_DN53631_c0_g1~~TRINITY_DN53631_c0_g1_i1.p1  ORF type:complete len:100 (-),score=22.91 TRINITY_DN53631_c0_g1_i1:294-593(-)
MSGQSSAEPRADSKDAVSKFLRTQTATWKSTVTEVEELLDACMRVDEKLGELVERCHVPKEAFGGSVKETSADVEQASGRHDTGGSAGRSGRKGANEDG